MYPKICPYCGNRIDGNFKHDCLHQRAGKLAEEFSKVFERELSEDEYTYIGEIVYLRQKIEDYEEKVATYKRQYQNFVNALFDPLTGGAKHESKRYLNKKYWSKLEERCQDTSTQQ